MTVSSTTQKVAYSGDGTTVNFNYTFKIFAAADLEVIVRNSSGVESVKTLTTDYAVTGVGQAAGGEVQFVTAPAATDDVYIRRVLDATQETSYVEGDSFPAAAHEQALDRLTMGLQQLQEQVDRSVKASITTPFTNPEFNDVSGDRANKILAFDGSGNIDVTQELGYFRGNWASGVLYKVRDIVRDNGNLNVYVVNEEHTSSGSLPISSNADSAKFDLLIDATGVVSSASSAAASAAQTAEDGAEAARDAAIAARDASQGYATDAQTAESAASGYATAAQGSANTAAGSATDAEGFATDASGHATTASGLVTSATTLLNTTQASVDEFNTVYLGAQATAPSTSQDGALYFDTAANILKVWDQSGAQWIAATITGADLTKINTVYTDLSGSNTIGTVAGSIGAVQSLAPVASDIAAVALFEPDISTVAGQISPTNNISTVAGVSGEIVAVAGDSIALNAVYNNSTNINIVAGINAEITNVAGIQGAVINVDAAIPDIQAINLEIADINAVEDNLAEIQNVSTNMTAVSSVYTNMATVTNLNSNLASVGIVESNIGDVVDVADNLSGIQNFATTYLGAKTADPSVDNDGNPLVDGQLYYNTVDDVMKVYDLSSTSWVGWAVSGNTATRWEFLLTGDTTTIPNSLADQNSATLSGLGTDTKVYVNGVLLAYGDDYTYTNDSVTFQDIVPSGAIVVITSSEISYASGALPTSGGTVSGSLSVTQGLSAENLSVIGDSTLSGDLDIGANATVTVGAGATVTVGAGATVPWVDLSNAQTVSGLKEFSDGIRVGGNEGITAIEYTSISSMPSVYGIKWAGQTTLTSSQWTSGDVYKIGRMITIDGEFKINYTLSGVINVGDGFILQSINSGFDWPATYFAPSGQFIVKEQYDTFLHVNNRPYVIGNVYPENANLVFVVTQTFNGQVNTNSSDRIRFTVTFKTSNAG